MKIIIYGSTGTIGRQLIWQALDLGHKVTAFADEKNTLDDMAHPDLFVFEGDVLNFDDVLQSVIGQGVVMAARLEGSRNIVKAMEMSNIKRLIGQTTSFFINNDERYIRESGLHWTIVRPGALTNGKITGRYRHGFVPRVMISRADVALFMLMQITSNVYIHQSPSLSY